MSPDRVTPRHASGSYDNAVAMRVVCERLAVLLGQAAPRGIVARILGRPDLRLARLQRQALDIAARLRRWHEPAPGEEARTSLEDRASDASDYRQLLTEARRCGVSIT